MSMETAEASVAERVWETLEAGLSEGNVLPLRVLFATDDSEPAKAAEAFLAQVPLPAGSSIQVVTVLDASEWQVPESLKGAEKVWGRQIGEAAEARLARQGLQLTRVTLRGEPAMEILRAADAFHADLIVVGSHGRTGLRRFLLGSVAENVAKHATRPVLLARASSRGLRQVVLAVDGSAHTRRIADLTGYFPLPAAAQVSVCHVVRPYTPMMGPDYVYDATELLADVQRQQQAEAEILVEGTARSLTRWGKSVKTVVRHGDPATEILALAAEQEADLVVVGAQGMSSIQALLVGSVADRILRNAPCAVLLVR